eukprot:359782-Chlamydomonas_euryale.AAC.1
MPMPVQHTCQRPCQCSHQCPKPLAFADAPALHPPAPLPMLSPMPQAPPMHECPCTALANALADVLANVPMPMHFTGALTSCGRSMQGCSMQQQQTQYRAVLHSLPSSQPPPHCYMTCTRLSPPWFTARAAASSLMPAGQHHRQHRADGPNLCSAPTPPPHP